MNIFLRLLSLKNQYQYISKTEIDQSALRRKSAELLPATLPAAIKNYLNYCGYKNEDSFRYCLVNWKSARLKLKPDSRWTRISCNQVNFIDKPARVVYMKAMMLGLIKMEAIDKFLNGQGNMLVKVLKFFTVTNTKGAKMDVAELVTILAEAMLIPAYLVQPYITWTELNSVTIKGTITYKDVKASGIFYFNEYCELLRFETNDRCYAHNGKIEKFKWTAYAWNYKTFDKIKFPSNFMATWSLPSGDYTYFKGRVDKLIYT
jgi:hypothetical protein